MMVDPIPTAQPPNVTTATSDHNANRLAIIDGLRGIAVLAVLYHHSVGPFTRPGVELLGVGSLDLPLWAPLSNGWLGVSLFFVLSGFVLQLPFVSNVRDMSSGTDVRDFYMRRARRLLPLFYFAVVFGFIFNLPLPRKSLSEFAILMTVAFPFTEQSFFPPINWVLWSLGVEIWMSVFFPLLLVAGRRIGFGWLLIGVALFSLVVRAYGHELPDAYAKNPVLNWVKDGPFGRLDDFVLGMWIAQHSTWARNRSSSSTWVFLIAAVVVMYATAFTWDMIRLENISAAIVPFLNNAFQLGCVLGLFALLGRPCRIVQWFFANRPLQLLGLMCYSIYVWHGIALLNMVGIRGRTLESLPAWLAVMPFIVFLSYRYIEFGHVRDTRSLFRTTSV